jgi:IS5 family transposase
VRLMVLKQRYRWGYRSLVAEVSDSIHLRRFCRISLVDRVPDESTVRKLTRRIGAETVSELTRVMIVKATREKRFRPRAVRIDSTVIEADIKHPTDIGLASVGVRALAREGRKLARLVREKKVRVRDRSKAMGVKLRAVARTIRRRSGEAKSEVLELTKQTGELLERSIKDARRLAQAARRRARGRGAKTKLKAARRLEELTDRCEKVASQIRQRIAGEKITDRIVSLTDPDARPIRKGKIGKVTEFGYVSQWVDPAGLTPDRQPEREHALARNGCRAHPPGHHATGDRRRWWVSANADQRRARRDRRQHDLHRWPPGTRLPAHPPPARAVPNRDRGPNQSPQTPLRAGPIPPEGRRRRADLD